MFYHFYFVFPIIIYLAYVINSILMGVTMGLVSSHFP